MTTVPPVYCPCLHWTKADPLPGTLHRTPGNDVSRARKETDGLTKGPGRLQDCRPPLDPLQDQLHKTHAPDPMVKVRGPRVSMSVESKGQLGVGQTAKFQRKVQEPLAGNTCLKHSCHPVVTGRLAAPQAGQGFISIEKAPESYSQHTPPSQPPCPVLQTSLRETAPVWAGSVSQRPQEGDSDRQDQGSFSIKRHWLSKPLRPAASWTFPTGGPTYIPN